MKKYKILSWMLSAAIILGSVSPVQALGVSNSTGSVKEDITNEVVIGQDTAQAQKSEYLDATNGTNTTNIYATIASIFDVTIPKTLILDGQSKTGQYSVKIDGDIAGEETILVIPDETFTMKQSGKEDVTAIISQDKTDWTYDQFDTLGIGTVTVQDLTAGSWSGSFNFNISKNLMAGSQVPMSSVNIVDENGTDLNGIGIVMDLNDPIIKELNNDNISKALNITCDEFEGLATATIDVSDFAKDGELVAVYHYDEEISEWEYITTATVINGQIEAEFDSFSPVAFEVVDHVHDYTESITKEATCAEEGVKTFKCSCGDSYTEPIEKTEHTISSAAVAATCTEAGYEESGCTACGYGYSKTEIPALGHDYKSIVTDPTCEEKGYTTHTCTRCNDTYKDTEVAATGHSYGSYTTTKAATCTVDGSKQRICTTCGNVDTAVIAKLGHDYATNYTIDKAATCTVAGSKSQHCSRCTSKQNVTTIPATGHTNINGGTSAIHTKCKTCGVTTSTAHSYTRTVQTAATCTTKGTSKYTCNCGYSYTSQDINATGHTNINGGTSGVHTKCKTCGVTTSTAHSYTSSVAVAATCTAKGTTKYTCSCGYSYTSQNINALGHSYSNGKCIRCGTSERINIILNDTLQSDANRSIIYNYTDDSGYGKYSYLSNTSYMLESDGEGDDPFPNYLVVQYNKAIPGNGKKLYVNMQLVNTSGGYVGKNSGFNKSGWVVQLVNASNGAVTNLNGYYYAPSWTSYTMGCDSGRINPYLNGAYYQSNETAFNAANNTLVGYQLPSSGTYYVRFVLVNEEGCDGARSINYYIHNCYVDN